MAPLASTTSNCTGVFCAAADTSTGSRGAFWGALAAAPVHPLLQRAQPQPVLRGELLLRQAARLERLGGLEPLLHLNRLRHSDEGPP